MDIDQVIKQDRDSLKESSPLQKEWELLCAAPQAIFEGICERADEIKKDPMKAVPEVIGAALIGGAAVYASKNPAMLCKALEKSKFLAPLAQNPTALAKNMHLFAAGAGTALTAVDLGVRAGVPMWDTYWNPQHLEANKKLLGKNLGSAVVDYPLMGLGGIGGAVTVDLAPGAIRGLRAVVADLDLLISSSHQNLAWQSAGTSRGLRELELHQPLKMVASNETGYSGIGSNKKLCVKNAPKVEEVEEGYFLTKIDATQFQLKTPNNKVYRFRVDQTDDCPYVDIEHIYDKQNKRILSERYDKDADKALRLVTNHIELGLEIKRTGAVARDGIIELPEGTTMQVEPNGIIVRFPNGRTLETNYDGTLITLLERGQDYHPGSIRPMDSDLINTKALAKENFHILRQQREIAAKAQGLSMHELERIKLPDGSYLRRINSHTHEISSTDGTVYRTDGKECTKEINGVRVTISEKEEKNIASLLNDHNYDLALEMSKRISGIKIEGNLITLPEGATLELQTDGRIVITNGERIYNADTHGRVTPIKPKNDELDEITCEFFEDYLTQIEDIIRDEQFKTTARRLSEGVDWRPNHGLPEDYYSH